MYASLHASSSINSAMKMMKSCNSPRMSYISVAQRAIPLKPYSKQGIAPPKLFSLQKAGYLLFLLAISLSLSIFRVGIPPCASDQRRAGDPPDGHVASNATASGDPFWQQPEGRGYRPCLNFSKEYQQDSIGRQQVGRRRAYLMVVVSGGLNQQRNQIVDAVVMARILEAVLVLPVLQVNTVWGDESEFSDIFDEWVFKETLRDDVKVVSSLPATHLRRRPAAPPPLPINMDETWVRDNLMPKLNKDGTMILRGFDSRLSKNLNPDLQKLRCKVAFHALKFRPWIEELGEKLAKRMMGKGGAYMSLHLRLEKDVWVRTGCLPGLGDNASRTIELERGAHPELLTSRTKMTPRERYLAGLCPLNALEIARLLKALGASEGTPIYWAGGEPFGGNSALEPLVEQFPHFHNKWSIAEEGELDGIKAKPSLLAAIDYIVCLKSQVFMANHGGNMARSLQGHRAYNGHQKHITPNKRQLVQVFSNSSLSEAEEGEAIRLIHSHSMGSPLLRTEKPNRDVVAFPVPECMCSAGTRQP